MSEQATHAAAKFVWDNELAIENGSSCEQMVQKIAALLDDYVKDSKEWAYAQGLRDRIDNERATNDHRLLVIGGLTRRLRAISILLKECQQQSLPERLMANVSETIEEIESTGPTKLERNFDERRGFERAIELLRGAIATTGVTPQEAWKYRDAAEWLEERMKAEMS